MSQDPSAGPTGLAAFPKFPVHLDYSLTGENATRAIERGLAEAEWYHTPLPRTQLRRLLERKNGPAIRDTLFWFGMLGLSGLAIILSCAVQGNP